MMVRKMILPLAAGMCLLSCTLFKKTATKNAGGSAIAGSAKTNIAQKDTAKKIKPYSEVITTEALTQQGLFKVHQVNDRWYFEIPDSLLDRDILIVNRIIKAPPLTAYGGDEIGENIIQFSKGPAGKLFLKKMFFLLRAADSSQNGLQQAVNNSNYHPIAAVFDIKAFSPNLSGVVIDLTDYLNTDSDILFFSEFVGTVRGYKFDGYQRDKSFLETIRAYPANIEIKTIKTFTRQPAPYTFELNSSWVLLPKQPMQPRYPDQRVGYFASGQYNYSATSPVDTKWMIERWKLEPKKEDIGRYLRGELVEPRQPIVFYIDPATPPQWVPFLIKGVNDWQRAFEKAGFKNAIFARTAPDKAEDSTWSLEDARHNVIVYKASQVRNASGPHIIDPRSGEVLESHVNWYHNVMELLREWYMIQAGPNDPRARKVKFDEALMGELIRFVCAHEVGHTLGLRHNFLASSTVPTDSLRSSRYLAKNGFCPSIMDYARFNYVAQPEDNIDPSLLMPRIGMYDEWAIEWGYRWFPPFSTESDERTYLTNWVTNTLKKDKRFEFGTETLPDMNLDPGRQSEDLGNDPVKSAQYGIQNLKRVVPQLKEWTSEPAADYEKLKDMYNSLRTQYFRYITHVATIIGGVYWQPKYQQEKGEALSFPSQKQQKEAVQFLIREVFNTPGWLMDNSIYRLITSDPSILDFPGNMNFVNILQRTVLVKITSHKVTSSLLLARTSGSGTHYSVDDLFNDLEAGIWKQLQNKAPIDIYQRNLQKYYAERLIELSGGYYASRDAHDYKKYPLVTTSDVYPIIKSHLRQLLVAINKALPGYKDQISHLHLTEVKTRIENALEKQKGSWLILPLGAQSSSQALQELNAEKKPGLDEKWFTPQNCWESKDAWDQ